MADRTHLSIGEVLSLLQGEFPDVTISKIRFLESQGLLDPERTPSGYRKFYEDDIARLRWILHQQRDNFLPLKVIKGRLDEGVDLGEAAGSNGGLGRGRGLGGAAPSGHRGDHDLTSADDSDDADPTDDGAGRLFPMHDAVDRHSANGGRAVAETGGASARARTGHLDRGDDPDADRAPATGDADPGADESANDAGDGGHRLGEHDDAARFAAEADGAAGAGTGRPASGDAPPPASTGAGRGRPDVSTFLRGLTGTTLSLEELASATGVEVEVVAELERFGLVESRRQGPNTVYGDEAVTVVRLAAAFIELGLEPRHLRMYKIATERETGLFLQLIGPLLGHRNQSGRSEASARLDRLTGLGEDLRRVLVRRQIVDYLGDG